MTKIEAIIAAFKQNSLSITAAHAEDFVRIAKRVFAEPTAETPYLVSVKAVKETDGKYMVTNEFGEHVLVIAAELHMEYLKSQGLAPKEIVTKKARGVSDEMTALMEHFKALVVEKGFDFKNIEIDRSNYYININKRKHYVRRFEVRRDGTVRVFTYGLPQELLENYTKIGAVHREAGKNCYIDMPSSIENINKLVEITVSH